MYLLFLILSCATFAHSQGAQPLQLQQTVPLPGVKGRIDHLSTDVKGKRLFVAALGNATVEVVDLIAGNRTQAISGLDEPQGLLNLPSVNRLYVASGGMGRSRFTMAPPSKKSRQCS